MVEQPIANKPEISGDSKWAVLSVRLSFCAVCYVFAVFLAKNNPFQVSEAGFLPCGLHFESGML